MQLTRVRAQPRNFHYPLMAILVKQPGELSRLLPGPPRNGGIHEQNNDVFSYVPVSFVYIFLNEQNFLTLKRSERRTTFATF